MKGDRWVRCDELFFLENIEAVVDCNGVAIPRVVAVKLDDEGVHVRCLMANSQSMVLGAGKCNDAEHVVEFEAFVRGGKIIKKQPNLKFIRDEDANQPPN